ncbi:MAG TPA: hypothetical protein VJN21_11945 [Candidatus Acidoferrales bacterium]|nr:hypothetical protein [Candidatus Acidoferrales bacterium]
MAHKKAAKKGKTLKSGKVLRKQKTLSEFPIVKTTDASSPKMF